MCPEGACACLLAVARVCSVAQCWGCCCHGSEDGGCDGVEVQSPSFLDSDYSIFSRTNGHHILPLWIFLCGLPRKKPQLVAKNIGGADCT